MKTWKLGKFSKFSRLEHDTHGGGVDKEMQLNKELDIDYKSLWKSYKEIWTLMVSNCHKIKSFKLESAQACA